MELNELVRDLRAKNNVTEQICFGVDYETETYTIDGKVVKSEDWLKLKSVWEVPVSYNCNKFYIEKYGYTECDIIRSSTDKNSCVFVFKTYKA